MSNNKLTPVEEAKETLQSMKELYGLVSIGLEPETLATCLSLCEAGVNPEVLAAIFRKPHGKVQPKQEHSNSDPTK